MTLEIEYKNGNAFVITPRNFNFFPITKKGILGMPKPFRTLYCIDVERRLTEHGTVYTGIIEREKDDEIKKEAKFYLYL